PSSAENSSSSKTRDVAGLTGEQQDALQSCLAECIGPMAAIICEDHLSSARPFAEIVDALAAE
ncbi:MAG TPA: hypothetical protein DDY32_05890, partial [Desulfobulbaceae bacterium]|nr:hypothetical protein [Desulfobulbaceae bacterium]